VIRTVDAGFIERAFAPEGTTRKIWLVISEEREMCRSILPVAVVTLFLLSAAGARADFFADFETPPYTAGALNQQQGWYAGSNASKTNSVLTITSTPTSPSPNPTSGTQSLFGRVSAFAFHNLTDVSPSNDVEQISFLADDTPLSGGTTNLLTFDIAKQSNSVSYVTVWGNNPVGSWSYWDGSGTNGAAVQHSFTPITLGDWYRVTVTITYSTQKYIATFEDVTAGTAPVSTASVPLIIPSGGAAVAGTASNMLFRGLAGAGNASTVGSYFDNISEVPEPASIGLFSIAILGLARRRPKQ
jgi:hypothetical protein